MASEAKSSMPKQLDNIMDWWYEELAKFNVWWHIYNYLGFFNGTLIRANNICIIRSTHGLWWANVCLQNNVIVLVSIQLKKPKLGENMLNAVNDNVPGLRQTPSYFSKEEFKEAVLQSPLLPLFEVKGTTLPHDCKKVPNQPCMYTRLFQRYPPSCKQHMHHSFYSRSVMSERLPSKQCYCWSEKFNTQTFQWNNRMDWWYEELAKFNVRWHI
jgi:hypothetical protein